MIKNKDQNIKLNIEDGLINSKILDQNNININRKLKTNITT